MRAVSKDSTRFDFRVLATETLNEIPQYVRHLLALLLLDLDPATRSQAHESADIESAYRLPTRDEGARLQGTDYLIPLHLIFLRWE